MPKKKAKPLRFAEDTINGRDHLTPPVRVRVVARGILGTM